MARLRQTVSTKAIAIILPVFYNNYEILRRTEKEDGRRGTKNEEKAAEEIV